MNPPYLRLDMCIYKKPLFRDLLLVALPLLFLSVPAWTTDDHHENHQAHNEGAVNIPAAMARKLDIKTEQAKPGRIERHLQVYGKLVVPPEHIAHIGARFPGVVKEIRVNVGDRVRKDQVLAIVESNQSLQTYPVITPIDGVIQKRTTNAGEMTGDAPLFTILNSDRFWAELKVFPSQRFEVQPGQSVHIHHNNHIHEGEISSITPIASEEPVVLARVVLQNRDGDMAPGDLVSGQIDAEKVDVNLLVKNQALQTLHGREVVFVLHNDTYRAQPVELGRSDEHSTEILAGLDSGDRYVVHNSYLLKADVLKSGAAHHH